MSGHSKIGASSMHRWMHCPGSVKLSEGKSSPPNPHAILGTRAHELAAALLAGEEWYSEEEFEQEFFDAVGIYVELITKECLNNPYGFTAIEKGFAHPKFHPGFYGTCDVVHYDKASKTLRVYDYKHGKGHKVHVEGNVQLLFYALGAVLEYQHLEIEQVELVIVQPRMPDRKGNVVHRWKFSHPETLMDFAADFLMYAAETEKPDAKLVVGDYCYFCPAVMTCPAQHAQRNERARKQFSEVSET